MAFHHTTGLPAKALLCIGVFGALVCGCRDSHPPAPVTPSTPNTHHAAPTVPIRPLPVRPVQKSQPTTSDKCPTTGPDAPVAPTDTLVACDLAGDTRYTLGPQIVELGLAHVDPPKSLTSGFYEVTLRLDPASATAWAEFTGAHVHDHVAFVREDLVLEAPIIEEHVTSGRIALTTQRAELANRLARLVGRPA